MLRQKMFSIFYTPRPFLSINYALNEIFHRPITKNVIIIRISDFNVRIGFYNLEDSEFT